MSGKPLPPDWYPDPSGSPEQRFWDGERWTAATRPIPPRRRGRRVAACLCGLVAAIALVALYASGRLDEPLSSVGLNSRDCIENVFGNRTCGDAAVTFCRENYDPDLNANVCDDVLKDAGEDPTAIAAAAEQQEQEDRERLEQELQQEQDELDRRLEAQERENEDQARPSPPPTASLEPDSEGIIRFTTDSRDVVCVLADAQARCGIVPGDEAYAVDADGGGYPYSAEGEFEGMATSVPVLTDGEATQLGRMACRAEAGAVTCTSIDGGGGFTVSPDEQNVF